MDIISKIDWFYFSIFNLICNTGLDATTLSSLFPALQMLY